MELYQQLEQEYAEWGGCGRLSNGELRHAVAVSSGTSALHLALEALQLPQGSDVILSQYCMIACARAVVMAGLKPVFVDCGDDLLIDVYKMKQALTPETRAVMPIHIFGRRCNMETISDFCVYHGLAIIEDLAEAHGIPPHPDTTAACWSFYRNKIICGEEGGMIAFNRPEYADQARQLRSLGFTEAHDFLHIPRGVNARMSNLHAAPILDSLRNFNENRVNRRWVLKSYLRLLVTHQEIGFVPAREDEDWADWVMPIKLLKHDPEIIVLKLNEMGIQARLGFKPASQQEEFYDPDGYMHLNAYRLSRQVMYLPIHPSMTEQDVRRNCEVLISLLG